MKIRKAEIESFGCFKNKVLEFEDSIQIIYGKNEAGKSTLMEFIKIMLYSDIGRSLNSEIRENKISWEGGRLSGILSFEDNGKLYKVQKEFDSKTPSKDKVFLQCLPDNQVIPLGKKEEVGKKFLGVNFDDFERSGYIDSLGDAAFTSGKNVKEMMINLTSSADKEVSKKESEKRLDDAIRQLKWKNKSGGKIFELEKEIFKIQESIRRFEEVEKQQLELKSQILEIENLIKEKNFLRNQIDIENLYKHMKNLEKLESLLKNRKEFEDFLKKEGVVLEDSEFILHDLSEKLKEMENLESELENLEKNINSSYNIEKSSIEQVSDLAKKKKIIEEAIFDIDKLKVSELKYILKQNQIYKEKIVKLENLKYEIVDLDKKSIEYKHLIEEKNKKFMENQLLNIKYREKQNQNQKCQNKIIDISQKQNEIKKISVFTLFFIVLAVVCFVFSAKILSFGAFFIFIFLNLGLFFYILHLENRKKMWKNQENHSQEDLIDVISLKIENNEKAIKQLEAELSNLNSLIQKQVLIKEAVCRLESEINAEKKVLFNSFEHFKENIYNIFENISEFNLSLVDINIYSSENKIDFIISFLKDEKSKISNLIFERTRKNNCRSIDEMKKNYEKSEELKLLIELKKLNLDKTKNSFLEKISKYKKLDSYSDAKIYSNKILEILYKKNKNDDEITSFSEYLGVKVLDLSHIENLILKTKNKIEQKFDLQKNYKNNLNLQIEGESVEIFEERFRELENKDLDKIRDNLLSKLVNFSESRFDLEAKLDEMKDKLNKKIFYLESLELAKNMLEKSYSELKSKIFPYLDKRISFIMSKLTFQKYNMLSVNDRSNIFIKTGFWERKYDLFSSGTIDQAYLSLRLALSELISNGNKIPIILDDVLVRYDEDRLYKAISYLKEYSKENSVQIILLTCHKYICDMGKGLLIPVKNI